MWAILIIDMIDEILQVALLFGHWFFLDFFYKYYNFLIFCGSIFGVGLGWAGIGWFENKMDGWIRGRRISPYVGLDSFLLSRT